MAVSKVLLTIAIFWAYGVLKRLPLAVFLFFLKASASIVYVLLQKPLSSGKRISRAMVSETGSNKVMFSESLLPAVVAYLAVFRAGGWDWYTMDPRADLVWSPQNSIAMGAQRLGTAVCSGCTANFRII